MGMALFYLLKPAFSTVDHKGFFQISPWILTVAVMLQYGELTEQHLKKKWKNKEQIPFRTKMFIICPRI